MKNKFFKYQAQTTNNPIGLEILKAEGSYIYDKNNKKYLDFVAGVSASNLGHKNKKIKDAVIDQIEKYWHVMVYGEFIQEPTIKLCELISENLPNSLSNTYLTNSGTEAVEAAMKLAKRVTARSEFIAAKNSYHGNTQGAMSIMGFEERKRAYRPLLPDINFIEFNNENDILLINNKTSAVILETIQGGAGFIIPSKNYLKKIKNQCEKVGALLILDEIQPGIGRTGKLFAYEHYGIIPDILVYGKGLGGGFPIGALSSSFENMSLFKENPILGHHFACTDFLGEVDAYIDALGEPFQEWWNTTAKTFLLQFEEIDLMDINTMTMHLIDSMHRIEDDEKIFIDVSNAFNYEVNATLYSKNIRLNTEADYIKFFDNYKDKFIEWFIY